MRTKGKFWIALFMLAIFSCVVSPVVNAETFNVGEKMETDLYLYSPVYHPFTSGAIVRAGEDDLDLIRLILDGNLSTGFETNDTTFASHFKIYFPYPLNVTNITVKPSFGNGSSNYTLTVFPVDTVDREFYLCWDANGERIFEMNCFICAIDLDIFENGTDQFYFNDLIINYTPTLPNLEELQNQIIILSQQFNLLNGMINQLNNSINEMNLTNEEDIFENITILIATYNQLNDSFTNLINEIDNIDNRIYDLESENTLLKNEVENLTLEIEELKSTKEEPDNFLIYVAIMLGLSGIVIAIIGVVTIYKKLGSLKPPKVNETKE